MGKPQVHNLQGMLATVRFRYHCLKPDGKFNIDERYVTYVSLTA